MEDGLEAGASDFQSDEDVFEIDTEPDDFSGVLSDLEKNGYQFVSAEVEMVPSTTVKLETPEAAGRVQRLIDLLEDDDDVQNVWHNWDNSDEMEEN